RQAFDREYTDRRQVPVLCRLIEEAAPPVALTGRVVAPVAPAASVAPVVRAEIPATAPARAA
ncbi:MAG: hypothetical protein ACKOFW_13810, partial [Planctomycetaceae bacterium]